MNQADTTKISVAFIGQRYWCDVMTAQLSREGVNSAVIRPAPANFFKRLWWIIVFLCYYRRKYSVLHIVGIGSKVREANWAHWNAIGTTLCGWRFLSG